MLNDCITGMNDKETEASAVKYLVKSLHSVLVRAHMDLGLEEARFRRKLKSKNEQLLVQIAWSKTQPETLTN